METPDQKWSRIYSQGRDFRLISSQEIDSFLAYLPANSPKTCLDIGCGTGQLSRELFHRGLTVTGIDASANAIKRAAQLTVHPNLSYIHLDIEQATTSQLAHPASYGLITCKLVYAFIQNKPAFLEKVRGLLNPNGIFVVITPRVDDVEPDKRAIAVDDSAIHLLEKTFKKVTLYTEKGLSYFIGVN